MARINIDQSPETPPPAPISGEIVVPTGDSLFSSFLLSPVGISFGESEEGEKIVLLLRAHWLTNFSWLAVSVALFLGPIIIFPLLSAIGFSGIPGGTGFVFIVFWYLGTFTFAFLNFLYWYFNVYIVTNHRIIDIDWYSVVVRQVSSMNLAKIQDVSSTQVGALSGIFDFGNVEIQTAAEEENFEFLAVPQPQLVAKKIDELAQNNA